MKTQLIFNLKDGHLFITSVIDPLLLLIQLLVDSRKKSNEHEGYFCDFSQILNDIPAKHIFQKQEPNLELICDINSKKTRK